MQRAEGAEEKDQLESRQRLQSTDAARRAAEDA